MHIRHRATEEPAFDREPRNKVLHIQKDGVRLRQDRPFNPRSGIQKPHRLGCGLAGHLAKFRHDRQQRLGIGMLRVLENLFDRTLF